MKALRKCIIDCLMDARSSIGQIRIFSIDNKENILLIKSAIKDLRLVLKSLEGKEKC